MTLAEVSSVSSGLMLRDKLMWNHTSSQMALLANVNSSKGKKYKPEDFNPHSDHKKAPTKATAQDLYEQFKTFT